MCIINVCFISWFRDSVSGFHLKLDTLQDIRSLLKDHRKELTVISTVQLLLLVPEKNTLLVYHY
jgi:hypothetical protein